MQAVLSSSSRLPSWSKPTQCALSAAQGEVNHAGAAGLRGGGSLQPALPLAWGSKARGCWARARWEACSSTPSSPPGWRRGARWCRCSRYPCHRRQSQSPARGRAGQGGPTPISHNHNHSHDHNHLHRAQGKAGPAPSGTRPLVSGAGPPPPPRSPLAGRHAACHSLV